jgi:hypothetical protein
MKTKHRVRMILVSPSDLTIALATEEGRPEGDCVILNSGRPVSAHDWHESPAAAWSSRGRQLLDIAKRLQEQGIACMKRAKTEKAARA